MKLTPEQLRQNAAAMIAHAEGKPVQWREDDDAEWTDTEHPIWQCDDVSYRPKPEPKTRQWSKPDDVPGPVCWLRVVDDAAELMVVGMDELTINISQAGSYKWSKLHEEGFQYSTDRKTWHKCEVSE